MTTHHPLHHPLHDPLHYPAGGIARTTTPGRPGVPRNAASGPARRLGRLLPALALLLAGLAACGGGDESASSAEDHNAADVAFAQGMLPHHTQALAMVDMTQGRDLDPEFADLAARIRAAQTPEIETMQGWLEDWTDSDSDHMDGMDGMDGMSGMHGDGSDGMTGGMSGGMSGMNGMVSSRQLARLASLPDDTFQVRWLQLMIAHHEGAIEMAETEKTQGSYRPALDLADDIVAAQTSEITTMRALIERLDPQG